MTFACSACGADREGTLRRARHWFTIFFIPLFPTNELGHDVRCGTCKSRFAPRILEVRTTSQGMQELGKAIRHGAAAMVLEAIGLAEVEHNARNNRMRAI